MRVTISILKTNTVSFDFHNYRQYFSVTNNIAIIIYRGSILCQSINHYLHFEFQK